MSDWKLRVAGTLYAIPQPGHPMLEIQDVAGGATAASRLTFAEQNVRHDTRSFDKNDKTILYYGPVAVGNVVFMGRIAKPRQIGDPGEEMVIYECYGPLARLNKVFWLYDGIYARTAYNLRDTDDEDYDILRADTPVQDIIEKVLTDTVTDQLAVADISDWEIVGTLPDIRPESVTYNAPTGVLDFIDQLLGWAPGWIRYVEPLDGTGKLWIKHVDDTPSKTITIGSGGTGRVSQNIVESTTSQAFGAAEIYGRRWIVDQVFTYDWRPPSPIQEIIPDWDPVAQAIWTPETMNDSEDLKAVFRRYKLSSSLAAVYTFAKNDVRAVPNAKLRVWAYRETTGWLGGLNWIRQKVNNFAPKQSEFTLSHPAYYWDDSTMAWKPSPIKIRLGTYTVAPITSRYPALGAGYGGSDFDGLAYIEDGVEDVWRKYSEKLVLITLKGTTTTATSDGTVIDRFLAARDHQLIGKKIYIGTDPFGYDITENTITSVETTFSGSVPAGTNFTILALDTRDQIADILEAVFPFLSASSYPIAITLEDGDSNILDKHLPFRLNIAAADAHPTGWESLDNIVVSWTLSFNDGMLKLNADDKSSVTARSWDDLMALTNLETRLEELEVWAIRNQRKTSTEVDDEGEEDADHTQSLTNHAHTGIQDGGALISGETLFTDNDPIDPKEAPITLVYTETFLGTGENWLAWVMDHQHYDFDDSDLSGQGGPLRRDLTMMTNTLGYLGLMDFFWDATHSIWVANARWSNHHHEDENDGGYLIDGLTQFAVNEGGTSAGPIAIEFVSTGVWQATWTNYAPT